MKAKLGDLGTSRFCSASLTVGLVSPQYSAMERMDGRVAKNTVETDLYSMGVTMCELFTGLPPNRSDRLDQVQVIRHRDFRYLCMQMVSDDISRRPSAAGALSTISRIRETEDYKACRPRRLVKGKADGAEDVTLIDLM
jgi:serine/threonine protein kinase